MLQTINNDHDERRHSFLIEKTRLFLLKNADIAIILFLLFLAAYLRPFPRLALMGRDETSYAFLIKHILAGTFLNDYIFYAFHPLYAFICAPLAAFGLNPELAGRIVSYCMGTMVIIPVYMIGKILFSRKAAFMAGFLVATFPPLLKQSQWVMSEATFTFFMTMGLMYYVLFIERKKVIYSMVAALFWGMSYLTRAEGAGIFFFHVLLTLFFALRYKDARKQYLNGTAIMIIIFFICAFPYMYALKMNTGSWRFSNKTLAALLASVVLNYGLPYEKYHFGNVTIDQFEFFLLAIKIYPKQLLLFILSLGEFFGEIQIILASAAIVFAAIFKTYFKKLSFFIPYLLTTLAVVFFFVQERYAVAYAPILFLITGAVFSLFDDQPKKSLNKYSTVIFIAVIILLTYGYIFKGFAEAPPDSTAPKITLGDEYAAYKKFGEEIAKTIEPGSKIMTRYNIVAWYANAEFIQYPYVSADELIRTLKNTDYIVLGPAEKSYRKETHDNILRSIKNTRVDNKFILVKKAFYPPSYEFTLIKVNIKR